MHVAHRVQQPGHLPLPGLDHARIRMAGGGHAKGGGQIQIFLPVGIPDVHASGAFPDDGPRTVRFDERDIARLKVTKQLQDGSGFRPQIYDLRFTICDRLAIGQLLAQS